MSKEKPVVGIIMGSKSDLQLMRPAGRILEEFDVPHEWGIKSAHRTPERMREYGKSALTRGVNLIIAGAGGSAHLQGMVAAFAPRVTVLGVGIAGSPDTTNAAIGSEIRMPSGTPLSFMGMNEAGATNAGLQAVKILAYSNPQYGEKLEDYYARLEKEVQSDDQLLRTEGPDAMLAEMKFRAETAAVKQADYPG